MTTVIPPLTEDDFLTLWPQLNPYVGAYDARSLKWAVEVAMVTVLTGLPCLTVATTFGLVAKRPWMFWLFTPFLLAIFTMLSFGLHGDTIPPVFPGAIEIALTSGRESLRTRAMLGALAWPVIGSLAVTALTFRTVSTSTKNPTGDHARPLTETRP